MKNILLSVFVIFASLGVLGCSEKLPDGMPKLYKVTLVFQQEGVPVSGASVRLVPQFTSQWGVGGSTNAQGQVQLKTHGEYVGVPAGKYKICVTKNESEGELPRMDRPTAPMKHFNLVEAQYSSPDKTTLEIEITDGKNKFEPFDLGKAVRVELVPPGSR